MNKQIAILLIRTIHNVDVSEQDITRIEPIYFNVNDNGPTHRVEIDSKCFKANPAINGCYEFTNEQLIEALFTLSMKQAGEIDSLRNMLSKTVLTMDKLTDRVLTLSQNGVTTAESIGKTLGLIEKLTKHE